MKPFTQTTDPQAWARAFIEVVQEKPEMALDEGFLIGWFANAFSCAQVNNEWDERWQTTELLPVEHVADLHCGATEADEPEVIDVIR
jgi:hypothetical protein